MSQVSQEEIVSLLKRVLRYESIRKDFLSEQVILNAASRRGIVVTEPEIQAESDRRRVALGLEKASDTLAWLQERDTTPEDWEAGVQVSLMTQKLKSQLFEPQLESFFYQNRSKFDSVLLYQIVLPNELLAEEIFYQIEEDEVSFYEAAHLYDVDEKRRNRCGYEGIVQRQHLPPEIAAALFSKSSTSLRKPIRTPQGFHLLLPEKFFRSTLNEEIREEITSHLFTEWLEGEINYLKHQTESAIDQQMLASTCNHHSNT